MKTTIDIAKDLLLRAKKIAKRDDITLKLLAEEGLRLALEQRERKRTVVIEPHVIAGKEAPPDMSWGRLREILYGDEGAGLRE